MEDNQEILDSYKEKIVGDEFDNLYDIINERNSKKDEYFQIRTYHKYYLHEIRELALYIYRYKYDDEKIRTLHKEEFVKLFSPYFK